MTKLNSTAKKIDTVFKVLTVLFRVAGVALLVGLVIIGGLSCLIWIQQWWALDTTPSALDF